MRVLVGCERNSKIRNAFAKLGHDAWSCDLVPSVDGGNHIQDNVLKHLDEKWDLGIFNPPCTHLAVSGAAWFEHKLEINPKIQEEALDFVRALMNAPMPKICIENPISIISTEIKEPTQIIQPYQFGENAKKTTCLWLKNLPKLRATKIVEPEITTLKTGAKFSTWEYKASMNHKQRSQLRSVTFQGIADAMAEQWGNSEVYKAKIFGGYFK